MFNEFRDNIQSQANPGRPFRLIGLVSDAQHKIARSGNKYGNFIIEDYSGKTDFVLFSEDYLRLSPFLQQGSTVFITGYCKQRYNRDEFEFKVMTVSLAETVKKNLTRQLTIEAHPKDISPDVVAFVEKNIKSYPGKSSLKFSIAEPKKQMKISLITMGSGFEMNEELIQFLEKKPEFDVQVLTV